MSKLKFNGYEKARHCKAFKQVDDLNSSCRIKCYGLEIVFRTLFFYRNFCSECYLTKEEVALKVLVKKLDVEVKRHAS